MVVFVLILIVLSWIYPGQAQCDGTTLVIEVELFDTKIITSPNYPGTYSQNLNCTWRIDPSQNSSSLLYRLKYNGLTQDTNDALQMYEGCDDTGTPSLFESKNSNLSPNGISWKDPPGTSVFVKFTTDNFDSNNGFIFELYIMEGVDKSGGACTSTEYIEATTTPQFITSPGFPSFYGRNTECNWNISSAVLTNILVSVVYMVLDPDAGGKCYDKVFFEGNPPVCFKDEWNINKTYEFNTSSIIRFTTDNIDVKRGFVFSFVSVVQQATTKSLSESETSTFSTANTTSVVSALFEKSTSDKTSTLTGTPTVPTSDKTSTSSTLTETPTVPTSDKTSTVPAFTETSTVTTSDKTSTSQTLTETSTVSTSDKTSTSPTLTETSIVTTSDKTSTSPTLTETSTSPTLTETSTVTTSDKTSTSPTLTETSTVTTLNKTSTSPTLTETSTVPTADKTSTSPTLTETSTVPTSDKTGISSTDLTSQDTTTTLTLQGASTDLTSQDTSTTLTLQGASTDLTSQDTSTTFTLQGASTDTSITLTPRDTSIDLTSKQTDTSTEYSGSVTTSTEYSGSVTTSTEYSGSVTTSTESTDLNTLPPEAVGGVIAGAILGVSGLGVLVGVISFLIIKNIGGKTSKFHKNAGKTIMKGADQSRPSWINMIDTMKKGNYNPFRFEHEVS